MRLMVLTPLRAADGFVALLGNGNGTFSRS
jgi:hypothetical protein